MTVTTHDDKENKVDFQSLVQYIMNTNTKLSLKPCTSKRSKTQDSIHQFKHQINVNMACYNSISKKENDVNIKVFINGRLHITGCNSMEMLHHVIQTSCHIMNESNTLKNSYNIDTMKKNVHVHMINVPFHIQMKVNQKALGRVLHDEYSIFSVFNPKNYSGIIIKVPIENEPGTYVTLLVFHSGKSILSGAKSIESINYTLSLYDSIVESSGHLFKSNLV